MRLRFCGQLALCSLLCILTPLRIVADDEPKTRTINQRIEPVWEDPTHFTFLKETTEGDWITVRVDAVSGEIAAVESDASDEGRSSLRGGSLPRSQSSATDTEIRFINQTDGPVELFWIDPGGRRQSYGMLAAGETRHQHTFAGHAWMVRSGEGTFYGSVVAGTPLTIAKIETEFPEPRREMRQRRRRPAERPDRSQRSERGGYEFRVSEGALEVRSLKRDAAEWTELDLESPADELVGPSWAPDGSVLAVWKVMRHQPQDTMMIKSSPDGGGRAELVTHPYRLPGDRYDEYELLLFDPATKRSIQTELPVFDFQRPRLRWFGDHQLVAEKIDRGHQRVRLFVIDGPTGKHRVAIDEQTPTFIWTMHGPPVALFTYLETTDEVLYASECSGFRHLYRLDLNDPDAALTCTVKQTPKGAVRELSGFEQAAVTRGDWLVREILQINEAERTVDVLAGEFADDQDPYHRHLVRVSLDDGTMIRVTEGDGDHQVQFSPDGSYAVVSYSRVDQPPVHELRRLADGARVASLMRAERIAANDDAFSLPEVFHAKGRDGKTEIWGNVYFPKQFDSDQVKRYPVIEAIYAGPHDSHVPKRYQHGRRFEDLTSLGFVVVQIDGMGTANRSKAFHDQCWHNLKDAGFPDRIAWMKALSAKYPALDLSRVGIFGTSAGGQNACGALVFHGDFYRAAYASCGCHDNRMDKASWNEQWMGYPVGPQYARSSNIDHAGQLRGDLFLVVGELDNNVPPESTYRLVDALISADKDFEFLMVPGMGHSDGGRYGRRRMREFFVRTLRP